MAIMENRAKIDDIKKIIAQAAAEGSVIKCCEAMTALVALFEDHTHNVPIASDEYGSMGVESDTVIG